MPSETDLLHNKNLSHHQPATPFRWTLRRGRQRLPTVRLGGRKRRGGFFLLRLCRKAKLKCLRLKYIRILKRMKKCYDSLVKDMAEGRRAMESFQQRMLLETSFVVPVMGLGFNTYPSNYHLY